MVPYHNCVIYETWRNKEVGRGRGFKVIKKGESLKGRTKLYVGS